ncbi:MAG: hypothetical protein HDS11_07605 [Bacteroides sp.]|nr:hypothetical protein [Bacteroides sp.]
MAVLLAVVAALLLWLAGSLGSDVVISAAARGFALPSPNLWFAGEPAAASWTNILLILAISTAMIWINGRYNILRSFSVTFVGLFLLMMAALPDVTLGFQGGTLLALAVLTGISLFYSSYNTPNRGSKRFFLTFAILAAGGLFQYGFAVFIPVFIIGLSQMHALRLRTLLAALLGIITPLWLWWGITPGEFPMPRIPQLDNPFEALGLYERIRFISTVGVTLFAGLILGSYNLVKIYSYNARGRALNGLLTLVSVITGVACVVDWTNVAFYVTLLNVCVAFQAGHFFHINIKSRTGYVTMLVLAVIYTSLGIWSLIG